MAFYTLTARSLAIPLPFVMAGVLVPVAMVIQMLPVSINGFGLREAVFGFFFVRFGLSVEAAVAEAEATRDFLLHLAAEKGVQGAMKERLLRAHFTDALERP